MFEEQMRALEQQQAQELLNIPVDSNGNSLQHLAASAPTTPPRVNALLPGGPEISPTIRTNFTRMGLRYRSPLESRWFRLQISGNL